MLSQHILETRKDVGSGCFSRLGEHENVLLQLLRVTLQDSDLRSSLVPIQSNAPNDEKVFKICDWLTDVAPADHDNIFSHYVRN